ncbi:MAG: carboxylating nicotinate-nucleotide diphosphorylase [Chloroflexota bacterium]
MFETELIPLPEEELNNIVDLALKEDLSHGDITSDILIPQELEGKAVLMVKARGVLAGNEVASKVFRRFDPTLKYELLVKDGAKLKPGDIIATISGKIISIVKAERVAVNFLQKLSGIASATAQYVARTRGFSVKVTDMRKTTPGLRVLEKYAVRMGGGYSHRVDLGDGVLIKDNHLVALRALGMDLKEIVTKAKEKTPSGLKVEVEVTTVREAIEAAEAGADIIMLDNMSLEDMRRAVDSLKGKVIFEASGGINLGTVRQVAMTGVDIISVGALTHSVKALDISLELEPPALKLL